MIAIARPDVAVDQDAVHEQFLEMLPRIERQARHVFRKLPSQARGEMVEEVVAIAFAAFARLVELDKREVAYSTPLGGYAIRQVRAGRRLGNKMNVRDLGSPGAPKARRVSIGRLDHFDRIRGEWREILIEDRRAGPAEAAASRIDFAAWLRSLPPRNRRVARLLARGESTSEVAASRVGRTATRISQLRGVLKTSWDEFHGLAAA